MKLFNSKKKKLVVASLMAAGMIGGGAVAANAAGGTGCKYLTYPLCARSVASSQIVDNSIISNDLSPAVRAQLNKAGQPGTPGKDGAPGTPGKDGAPGISGLHADAPYGKNLPGQDSSDTAIPAGKTAVVWTACTPGESALGGGYRIGDLSQESFGTGDTVAYPDLQVVASEAAFYKGGKLVNGAIEAPVNDNQSFMPNAWAVTVHNAGDKDSVARAWAVCATVAK